MNATDRDELLIRLDVGVNGNGAKGLTDRVDDLEDWKGGHPVECPVVTKRKNIIAVRGLEVAIAVAVFKGFDVLLKFAQAKGWL